MLNLINKLVEDGSTSVRAISIKALGILSLKTVYQEVVSIFFIFRLTMYEILIIELTIK